MEVEAQLRAYLAQHAPPTVAWDLKTFASAPGILAPRESSAVKAMAAALETVFGVQPIFRLEGGSIPVVGQIKQILGVDSLICGFGLPDDNLHAPNEKQHLPTFYRGIESYVHFFNNL